jgi:hypothetical protein
MDDEARVEKVVSNQSNQFRTVVAKNGPEMFFLLPDAAQSW